MVQTLASGSDPLITADEFLKRVDSASVSQLCTDVDGVPVDVGLLDTDEVLLTAIKDASGQLEAACLRGGRYSVADLEFLRDNSCNAQGHMFRILAGLAWFLLFTRRPNVFKDYPIIVKDANQALMDIREGMEIFGFVETVDAGYSKETKQTSEEARINGGTVILASRYFGVRGMFDDGSGG